MIKLSLFYSKLKNSFKFYFSKNISKNIFLGSNVQIFGLNNIIIMDNCTLGDNTLLTVNNRSNKNIQLTISSNVYMGRDNFVSVGKSIFIGDYSIFGNKCSLICSDHIFDSPFIPYALSGNNYEKKIKIGVNCWFGHGVTVVGDVEIGHGSIVGANTLITKDIPPFSMVVGNPFKIIKTFNFNSNKWEKANAVSSSIYYDEAIYLKYFIDNNVKVNLAYYSASAAMGHL